MCQSFGYLLPIWYNFFADRHFGLIVRWYKQMYLMLAKNYFHLNFSTMEQEYEEMISALTAAAGNIHNIPTPEEAKQNLGQLAGNFNAGFAIFKSLAMTDAIVFINQLNQFVDPEQVKLPFDDGALRANIINSAETLRANQVQNVERLNTIIATRAGVQEDGTVLALGTIVSDILEEIKKASLQLSLN